MTPSAESSNSVPGSALGLLTLLAACVSLSPKLSAQEFDFDASIRERLNYVSSENYAPLDRDDRWFWTQRLNLVGSVETETGWGGRVNVISALQSGVEPGPVNQNNLDIHELFVDAPLAGGRFRFGRQELALGSQRLVGTREGTNVRRNWRGVRWTRDRDRTSIETFYLELVQVTPEGAFNDSSDSGRALSGAYLTHKLGPITLDFYYMWARKDNRFSVAGIADQRRESVGVRHSGEFNRWSWNHEAVYQFGRHGALDIEAWTVASITGRKFEAAWQPELLLSMNVASGDDDPDDRTLGTFDALFPRGNYFSEAAVLGPSNFFNVHPQIRLQPTDSLSLSAGINWFWRLETEDGVYGPSGLPFVLPGQSDSRAVTRSISATIDWAIQPGLSMALAMTHSTPLEFLEQSGRNAPIRFVELTFRASL